MELEVILEAQPRSEVGQAAELSRGRGGGRLLSVQCGPALVALLSPSPPWQKAYFKKELEICVREKL